MGVGAARLADVPGPVAWGWQSCLEGGAHRGRPVVDPELGVDMEQMVFTVASLMNSRSTSRLIKPEAISWSTSNSR